MEEELCLNCRKAGRAWCPHNFAKKIKEYRMNFKQEMFGPSPPNLLVGHSNYPNVCWGPLVFAGAEAQLKDDPAQLYGLSLQEIIHARSSMVYGIRKGSVRSMPSRILQESQEAIMSIKPVDVEARFSKTPSFSFQADEVVHPIGASAPLEKFKVAQNPEVPKKVDEAIEEKMKANEAIVELLVSGFDVYYISKLLSAGILGMEKTKRLVPTKWAITATDDIAAKRFMQTIRECEEIGEILLYSNSYLDNHFWIILMPGKWEYEQFEFVAQRPEKIAYEHEAFWGRADYPESQGGGYFAARFAVAEYLYKIRRQARVSLFRKIGPAYSVPVGVWEVRENVRAAFRKPPAKFGSLFEALKYLEKKIALPIVQFIRRSKILAQRRLTEF
ncbi:MAG: hypothetical protein N3G80_03220 [Candidatus Micrarchaeota archaeon]|nr:hypothetical protein [Candidatus Micrarchaeota archaeon]